MVSQSRWSGRTARQVERLFIWIWLWCSTQREDQELSCVRIIATWNRGKEQEAGWRRYSWVIGVVSPAQRRPQRRKGRSSADKYRIFAVCDVNVSELQNELTKVAAILRARATLVPTEEAPTLEELAEGEAAMQDEVLHRQLDTPHHATPLNAMESL